MRNPGRSQIQNIAKSVVPKQALLDAQVELALACLDHELPPDVEPAGVRSLVSELPSRHKAARSLAEAIR